MGGVAAPVSVSEAKIQITLLILNGDPVYSRTDLVTESLVDLKSVLADPANFWGPGSLVLMIITFPIIIISNMSNDLPSAHNRSDFLALLAVKSAQSGAI